MYSCMRDLLALFVKMLSLIPLSIPMFLLCIDNLHFPLTSILMCPLIILRFVILMLIWAMRKTWSIRFVGMLKLLSLGNFSGYEAALDPYWINLVDKPRKVLWNTFFAFSFNFPMAFSLMKRTLIFFTLILYRLSYCHACEPHAATFDKLQRALTASNGGHGF